ncbi:MAG: lipid biosynthesis acyltransferase [Mucilaginibacter sp.]|jgi:predicted LPLAT superfamily acyltransferase|nr:lipid biosynthesis acyltransferase [Mucilaginibacter sp.]
MASWQGKSKGKPLGYKIFVSILRIGGVLPAYLLLRFVTFYYLIFSYKSTKGTFNYFHKRHGYGVIKSIYKIYQNYNLLGQSLIDKVVIMSGIPNKFTFDFSGKDNLHKIIDQKKGGLLLTAHIGNWETASHLLYELDARINIVTFDGEDQGIKEYMESVTGKSKRSVNFITINDDMSHIFKINDAFSNNELVCMPADRFLEGNKTVTVKFLGTDAKFPLGPFMLASRFKVPISFVFGMKESTFHYHFFASKMKEYLYSDKNDVIQQIVLDFVDNVEIKVKRYPEQWYNYYNFWQ